MEEVDINLLYQVQMTPSIYNPQHTRFRDIRFKNDSWINIASKINVDPSDAQRRWRYFREKYSKELRQMRNFPENTELGQGEFFERMEFLRPFVKNRNRDSALRSTWNGIKYEFKNSKLENSEQSCDDTGMGQDDEYSVFLEENTNAYNASVYNDECHKSMPQMSVPMMLTEKSTTSDPLLQQHKKSSSDTREANISVGAGPPLHEENEDDFFSKTVAAYLKQLARKHKIKAKIEIFQILEKYIEIEDD